MGEGYFGGTKSAILKKVSLQFADHGIFVSKTVDNLNFVYPFNISTFQNCFHRKTSFPEHLRIFTLKLQHGLSGVLIIT